MSHTNPEEMLSIKEYLTQHDFNSLVEDAVNECYRHQAKDPVLFLAQYYAAKSAPHSISEIKARQILDSRGNPTVEVDVYCGGKLQGRCSAPSGASTGSNEAKELRDGVSEAYLGKGVLKAVENTNTVINSTLKGKDVTKLRECDDAIMKADGTELKEKLGGNAVTAASFAVASAGAASLNTELFLHLATVFHGKAPATFSLPTPMVNILNGGKHAGGKLKIQEFMIVPRSDIRFSEQLQMVTAVYHHLSKVLAEKYGPGAKNLGDEGGFAPALDSPTQALSAIEEAVERAGYSLYAEGKGDIRLALDCAASEFYNAETRKYEVEEGKHLTSSELIDYYKKLIEAHPALYSIEDGLDEKDYEGWKKLTAELGGRIMVVGDDLYTTNPRLIAQGIAEHWANALLLKVNQIGTISEAMEAARLKLNAGSNVIVSHRSGETTTTLIADLAVALGAAFIKTGAPARGERVCKYNRLLQIEEVLRERGMVAEEGEPTAMDLN